MKTIALVTVASLAAFFSIGASAQTGRPSAVEVPAAAAAPTQVATSYGNTPGSYARYLMLNGATRDDALVAARNVDHPVERAPRVAASRRVAREPARQ